MLTTRAAKTKPTYLTRSSSGGAWTLLLIVTSVSLLISETQRWFQGTTHHTFSVEKGVAHTLQMNLDVVVMMECHNLHVNVQDASGDRVMAGEILKKEQTQWAAWDRRRRGAADIQKTGREAFGRGEDEDVHDYLSAARGRKKFPHGPRFRGQADACRIYGSLEGNKVQGDFHITARGHGYMEIGEHLPHDCKGPHLTSPLSHSPLHTGLTGDSIQLHPPHQ
jgi:endoplasmic reticulum-Golgi intermediate compartment protein 2